MVRDGDSAVGLIDRDLVHPAPALDDVAYALEHFAPFRSDAHAVRCNGFRAPPDRWRRIAVFTEAHGLDESGRLVDAVIARRRRASSTCGGSTSWGARVRWSETHHALAERPRP